MADERTFVLVSEFRDGVTPALEKINNSINTLKQSVNVFGSKKGGFNDLTKSMGKVINAHIKLKEEIAGVRNELKNTLPVLREYRKEVGKAVSANMHLGGKRFIKKNNPHLQYLEAATKQTRELAQVSRGVQFGRRMPRGGGGGTPAAGGGGGGGTRPPRTPGYPAGGGGGYVPPSRPTSTFGTKKFGVSRDETFAFGQTLGYTLGTTVTGAVVQGFQIGVGLMMKPFEYFAGAFGERIRDELDDLKAAGGLYSISKRSQNPFLRNIDEAIQFQQDTNQTFAKMAAALPGVTNDYVQVGKRLSDTAARIVATDFEKARTEANRIRATEEGRKFYGGTIVGTGAEQQKETIQTLLGELTKKTTIAGLGGRSGAGGIAGAYGLPGLTERMLSQEQVSLGQFQRYAAVFSDPTIMDALQRNVDKINATQLNTIDRFKAIQQLLDEVVTPELIEKLRTSVDGIYQGLRSAIFDPDTGLFGLGRNFQDFGRRLNQYGQYVNEAGEVVTDLNKAAKEDLSIFEILRDIFVNAGQVLLPIVEALPLIFNPLEKVANVLMDARHYTAEFARTFNQYREGLKALSETPGMDFIKDTLDIRASLSAINNLLYQFGIIGKGEFQQLASKLTSKDLNIGEVLSGLLDKVLNSKVAFSVGEIIGGVIGTVLSETAKVVKFFAGLTTDSGQLASGLKKGFYGAGGPEAFRSIIQNVFKALFNGLIELFKVAPLEISVIGAIALLIPAFVASVSIMLANWLEGVLDKFMGQCGRQLGKAKNLFSAAACPMPGGGLNGIGSDLKPNARTTGPSSVAMRPVGPKPPKGFEHIALPGAAPALYGVTQPGKAPSVPKPVVPLKKTPFGMLSKLKGKGAGVIASALISLETAAPGLVKAGKAIKTFAQGMPAVGIALAGLDFAFRKFMGEDTAKAAGGAIGLGVGGTLGGIAGSALGPVGTFVGGALGAWLGEWIGQNLAPVLAQIGSKLQEAWNGFTSWLSSGFDVGKTLGALTANLENTVDNVGIWFNSLPGKINNWAQGAKVAVGKAVDAIAKTLSNPSTWWTLVTGAVDGFKKALADAANWIKGLGAGFEAGYRENRRTTTDPGSGGKGGYQTRNGVRGWLSTSGEWTALPQAKGALGDAIASEMRMKPPGSDLVIANSSETVIPAAGGHGMLDFVETLRSGFNAMISTYREAQTKQETVLKGINTTLVTNQQQTNTRLQQLETKFSTPGMTGGLGGGAAGGVDAFTGVAQRFGLSMTSGYRPGDSGWHGANRARDFSNGTGPTPQMMQFAQYLASNYGQNLKELIYTPLGFSIKNGQRVPPYAQGSHYNHVHVAYALGYNNGRMFTSLDAAQSWENSMVPGSVKVASITGNSAEGFGGGTNVVNNITINQQPGQDADELASIVALKIGEAVADARSSSLFV
jgi:hypothetical protein